MGRKPVKRFAIERIAAYIIMLLGWIGTLLYLYIHRNTNLDDLTIWQKLLFTVGFVNYLSICLVSIILFVAIVVFGPVAFLVHLFTSKESIFSKAFWNEIMN